MTKQVINIGSAPNDNTGDSLRVGGAKINQNFTELYDTVGNLANVAFSGSFNDLTDVPEFSEGGGGGGDGTVTSVNNVLPDVAGNVSLSKNDLGLDQVDNTSDTNKPISTATQSALDLKISEGDSRLTDARTPTAHTHPISEVVNLTTTLATKVDDSDSRLSDARTPTAHTHATSEVTGLDAALATKYDNATDVTDALESLDSATAVALVRTLLEAIAVSDGFIKFSSTSGLPLESTSGVIPPSATWAQIFAGTAGSNTFDANLALDVITAQTVASAASITLNPATSGKVNFTIPATHSAITINLATQPASMKGLTIFVEVYNSGGGAKTITLSTAGGSGLVTMKYPTGVDQSTAIGSVANDRLFYIIRLTDPANNIAHIIGAMEAPA